MSEGKKLVFSMWFYYKKIRNFFIKFYLICGEVQITGDTPLLIQKQLPEVLFKKAALEIFEVFTGKHLC